MKATTWTDVTDTLCYPKPQHLEPTNHVLSDDAHGLMLRLGRVPYHVNFLHTKEEDAEYDEREEELPSGKIVPISASKYRTRVRTTDEGNVWSSHAYLKPEYHLPVIDVDARTPEVDKVIIDAFEDKAGVDYIPYVWEPSSSEGHHHLYIEWPFHWDDYEAVLKYLAAQRVIENGYAYASINRGATFVRFPWVKKELVTPRMGKIQLEVESGVTAGDPADVPVVLDDPLL